MRKIISVLAFPLFFSACSTEMELDWFQVERKEGAIFEVGADNPFTGKLKGVQVDAPRDFSEEVYSGCEASVKKGYLDGVVSCFNLAGSLVFKSEYRLGVRAGEAVEFDPNTGLVKRKVNFSGPDSGVVEVYAESKLIHRYGFEGNHLHGQSIEWNADGIVMSDMEWRHGKKVNGFDMVLVRGGGSPNGMEYVKQALRNGKKDGVYRENIQQTFPCSIDSRRCDWKYTETLYNEGVAEKQTQIRLRHSDGERILLSERYFKGDGDQILRVFTQVEGRSLISSESVYRDNKIFSYVRKEYGEDGELLHEVNYVQPYLGRYVPDQLTTRGLVPVGLVSLKEEGVGYSVGARDGLGENGCRYRSRTAEEVFWDNGIIVKRKVSVIDINDLEYMQRYIHYSSLERGDGPYFCDEPPFYYEVLADISDREYTSSDKYEAVSKDIYESFDWSVFVERGGLGSSSELASTDSDTISCTLDNDKKMSVSRLGGSPKFTYGQSEKVELELPAHSGGGTIYKGEEMFSGGGAVYVAFTNGDYTYVAYDGVGRDWEFVGLKVYKGSDVIMEAQCKPPSVFSLRFDSVNAAEGELPY